MVVAPDKVAQSESAKYVHSKLFSFLVYSALIREREKSKAKRSEKGPSQLTIAIVPTRPAGDSIDRLHLGLGVSLILMAIRMNLLGAYVYL